MVAKKVAYRGTVGQTERLMAKITTYLAAHPDSTRTTLRQLAVASNYKLFPRAIQALVDSYVIEETIWEFTYPVGRTYKMREGKQHE